MKLVIFDCDGVLVDSEAILVEAELDFFKNHRVEISRESYLDEYMGIPLDDWKAKASILLNNKLGTRISEDIFKPLEESISRRLAEELLAIDGAHEAISSLKNSICVASSSSITSLESKLIKTELFDLFAPHIFQPSWLKMENRHLIFSCMQRSN